MGIHFSKKSKTSITPIKATFSPKGVLVVQKSPKVEDQKKQESSFLLKLELPEKANEKEDEILQKNSKVRKTKENSEIILIKDCS